MVVRLHTVGYTAQAYVPPAFALFPYGMAMAWVSGFTWVAGPSCWKVGRAQSALLGVKLPTCIRVV